MTQRPDLTALQATIQRVRTSVETVIVGQHHMVDLMIAALLSDGHVLIEGPPGVAKTLSARVVARLLDCVFSRVQFTPDLMPADIIGTSIFNPKTLEFAYRKGPVFANVLLTDEINRAPAKTQAAMFEVMEERQVTTDGISYPLPVPFMVIATQNPIEHEGTYRLPEAQLDRFLFKVVVGYPTLEEESEILRRNHEQAVANDLSGLTPLMSAQEVAAMRAAVRGVIVEPTLLEYIAKIIQATRVSPALYVAASPRASIGILNAAKAIAAINGRDFVMPDDVQFVARPVLRHRILVQPEREMEGMTPDVVIDNILRSIDIPR